MGTELCYVFTGDVEDHTMRLLPELVKNDISALRKIQSSNRFFPNKDGKSKYSF